MKLPEDTAGPTAERILHAGEFLTIGGPSKAARRYAMFDNPLGKAWMRHWVSDEEYSSLKRYALHWLAGGLQGPIQSVDLNRIYAHDPGSMSGLAKTEKQQDHRDAYHAARCEIGRRPAFAADQVACQGQELVDVGVMLGFRSPYRARELARQLLSEAGYRLGQFWKAKDRR